MHAAVFYARSGLENPYLLHDAAQGAGDDPRSRRDAQHADGAEEQAHRLEDAEADRAPAAPSTIPLMLRWPPPTTAATATRYNQLAQRYRCGLGERGRNVGL